MKYTLVKSILVLVCFFTISCDAKTGNKILELTGSTPGDATIKSMLMIADHENVDFIRWKLNFYDNGEFDLELRYGLSKPNTLDFEDGGIKKTIKGTYHVENGNANSRFAEVYELISKLPSISFSIAGINENVFHIMNREGKLMNGNGGWSYSLFSKNRSTSKRLLIKSPDIDETSTRLIFDGRTPCQELAQVHAEMKASQSCFKLKWRLVLNRDSISHEPGTCEIRNIVDNEPRNITGKWEIINNKDPDLKIKYLKVSVDNLSNPILFLIADENVLLFIDPDFMPFAGNENFGFALNRKLD